MWSDRSAVDPDELHDLLGPDEVVHRWARPHGRVLALPIVLAVVLALAVGFAYGALDTPFDRWSIVGVAIGWLLLAGPTVWRWAHAVHVLTSERVLVLSGRRGRIDVDLPVSAIEDVRVRRRALGALIGHGDVVLVHDGGDTTTLHDVRAPRRLRRRLLELRDADPQ